MVRLKKPIPAFRSEEEEAEYWERHSPLEHFDESDFKPLQVKAAKDRPITIRLDTESRQSLNEMAEAYKLGPSTLARAIIGAVLERWKRNQQISLTLEDAAEVLFETVPEKVREEMLSLYEEGETGNLYIFSAPKLERVGKLLIRSLVEASGIKLKPDDEAYKIVSERISTAKLSAPTRIHAAENTPSNV